MPTLNWLTREADLQKSRRAPYRLLEPPYNTKSAFEHYDDNLEHTRHLIFALPKVFRSGFRHRRRLLPKPAQRAWKAVVAVPTSVGFGAGVYASVINRL